MTGTIPFLPIPIQTVDSTIMGSHSQHWQSFGLSSPEQVPNLLQTAIDHAGVVQSLTLPNTPEDCWGLQDDRSAVGVGMVIEAQNDHAVRMRTAFPLVQSPYQYTVQIQRVICCEETLEAILEFQIDRTTLFAFDVDYATNGRGYQSGIQYQVWLSGLAHFLEKVSSQDLLQITEPEDIRYHRGLNAILAEHPDIDEATLHQKLQDWQPENDADLEPVFIDLTHVAAYVQSEQSGQQDEAWIAGKIIGQSTCTYMDQPFALYDVVIQRDDPAPPVVVRIAHCVAHITDSKEILAVGDHVRGNIWLQTAVCAICP